MYLITGDGIRGEVPVRFTHVAKHASSTLVACYPFWTRRQVQKQDPRGASGCGVACPTTPIHINQREEMGRNAQWVVGRQ